MRIACFVLASALLAAPAMAGDITVDVRDQTGRPVRDAVVMIKPAGREAGGPMKVGWPMVVAQQNIQFMPYVLIVPLGATVSFPNKDKVRHHVYSFSPAKKFELKLYGRDETRTVMFDKPGPVSLGCNIHDGMIGYVYVTETPYAAKSGTDGMAVVPDAPAGGATLLVWHPNLRARAPVAKALRISAANQRAAAVIEIRPAIAR